MRDGSLAFLSHFFKRVKDTKFCYGSFFGFGGLGLSLPEGWDSSNYNAGYTYFTDFIFQAMFAATAATIVAAVANAQKYRHPALQRQQYHLVTPAKR